MFYSDRGAMVECNRYQRKILSVFNRVKVFHRKELNMAFEGFTPYDPEAAELYNQRRWWLEKKPPNGGCKRDL